MCIRKTIALCVLHSASIRAAWHSFHCGLFPRHHVRARQTKIACLPTVNYNTYFQMEIKHYFFSSFFFLSRRMGEKTLPRNISIPQLNKCMRKRQRRKKRQQDKSSRARAHTFEVSLHDDREHMRTQHIK